MTLWKVLACVYVYMYQLYLLLAFSIFLLGGMFTWMKQAKFWITVESRIYSHAISGTLDVLSFLFPLKAQHIQWYYMPVILTLTLFTDLHLYYVGFFFLLEIFLSFIT